MSTRVASAGPRLWENREAEPFTEVADCTRGELRLAAEVAIAEITAKHVPTFAHERAFETLQLVARA